MTRIVQRSFASGELAPEFYGQSDQDFYRSGAKTLSNVVVTKEGSLRRRSGMEFIAAVGSAKRVLRFGANDGLDFVVVLTGDSTDSPVYIYRDGLPVSPGAPAAWAAGLYSPYSRVTHDAKVYYTPVWTDTEPGAVAAPWVETTTLMHPFIDSDLARIQAVQLGDVLTVTCRGYEPWQLTRGASVWSTGTAALAAPMKSIGDFIDLGGVSIGPSESPAEDDWHFARDWEWRVTALYQENGVWRETLDFESVGLYCCMTPDFRPRRITVSNTGTLPRIYRIYRGYNGLYGLVGEITGTASEASVSLFWDKGENPDTTKQPPVRLGADGLYEASTSAPFDETALKPAAVGFWNQRMLAGGFTKGPATLLFAGTEGLLDFTTNPMLDPADTDGIDLTLATREHEEVRAIVAASDLLVFTSRGEWAIRAEGIVTPRTLTAHRVSGRGSSTVPPIQVGNRVLFVSRAGAVYALGLDASTKEWAQDDLTALASHLFEGKKIIGWAYQQRPDSIIWCVLDDGTFLSLTYRPEAGIIAWAKHTTDGTVLDVAVADEGDTDTVYMTVRRTVSGNYVYGLERMKDVDSPAGVGEGFYLDGARWASGVTGTFYGQITVEPILYDWNPGGGSPSLGIDRLLGNPLAAYDVVIECTQSGDISDGTARVRVSVDGGATWGLAQAPQVGYNSLTALGAVVETGLRVKVMDWAVTLGETATFSVALADGYAQGGQVEVCAATGTFTAAQRVVGMQLFIGSSLSITSDSATKQSTTMFTGVLSQALPASYQYPVQFSEALAGDPLQFRASSISGFADFAGLTVSVLADGVLSTKVVSQAGVITLDAPAVAVIAGLPYSATLELLDPPDQKGTPARELVWMGVRCATAGAPALRPDATVTTGGQPEEVSVDGAVTRRTIEGTLAHALEGEVAGAVVQTYPYPLRILWVARDVEFQSDL